MIRGTKGEDESSRKRKLEALNNAQSIRAAGSPYRSTALRGFTGILFEMPGGNVELDPMSVLMQTAMDKVYNLEHLYLELDLPLVRPFVQTSDIRDIELDEIKVIYEEQRTIDYIRHVTSIPKYIHAEGAATSTPGYYSDLDSLDTFADTDRDIEGHDRRVGILQVFRTARLQQTRLLTRNQVNRPLPVQWSRCQNSGLAFVTGTPQLISPSRLSELMPGVVLPKVGHVQYYNYDPWVEMVPWTQERGGDFAYLPLGGGWVATEAVTGTFTTREHRWHLGIGNVIVAWHSTLGVGSTMDDIFAKIAIANKYKDTHGVSTTPAGHIIHLCFAYEAHFLWAAYELFLNLIKGQSTFQIPFAEKQTGRYHTVAEYEAGLVFLKGKVTPNYVTSRITVLTAMLIRARVILGDSSGV